MNTLLIVDDEIDIREAVKFCLRGDYAILEADSGQAALVTATNDLPDLIILDYMLPELNGLQVLQRLRADVRTTQIPVLMLTVASDDDTINKCFAAGADGYVLKPFPSALLRRQIHALLLHAAKTTAVFPALTYDSILLCAGKPTVAVDGVSVNLTPKETELLKYFLENQNKTLSRGKIIADVWGYSFDETRTVDYHVSRLRDKLSGFPGFTESLVSVRGSGYCLKGNQRFLSVDNAANETEAGC